MGPATSIYVSLVLHPNIGLGPGPQRSKDAVEICRILAGFGEDKSSSVSSKIYVMFFAVASGGLRIRSEEEAKWLDL
jgi:hypothetical protein